MIQRCLLVILACALFGCASPREFYQAKSLAVSSPAIGVETTRRPGDILLEQGTQREYDAIELTTPITLTSLGSFTLPAGRYLKASETTIFEFFGWDEMTSPTQGGINSGGETLREVALSKKENSRVAIVWTTAERVNDFAAPGVMNLLCRAAVFGQCWLSPGVAG